MLPLVFLSPVLPDEEKRSENTTEEQQDHNDNYENQFRSAVIHS
jgi:hypothetical protein